MTELTQWIASNQLMVGGAAVAMFGFVFAYLRSIPSAIYRFCKRRVTVTLDVEDRDEAFKWVGLYLAKHQKNSRDVSVVTRHCNKLDGDEHEPFVVGKARDNRPKIFLTPAPGVHFSWFKRRPMLIYRKRTDGGSSKSGSGGLLGELGSAMRSEGYTITFFSRNKELPRLFIEEARNVALPLDNKIDVRVTNTKWYGSWTLADRIRPRSIESVILAEDEHVKILDDVQKFLTSYEWYTKLGIPYRRGYLLYGDPGGGKTSLVTAVASVLKMNIYVLSLQAPGMNDSMLVDMLTSVSDNSIILIEDCDCAFKNRTHGKETSDKLTFSGLLNALDGVGGKDGRIIFMTTNHKENLDPALIRPGRIDYQIEIKNAVKSQAKKLFERFYADYEVDELFVTQFVDLIPDYKHSMAKLQGHLMNYKDDPLGAIENCSELDKTDEKPVATVVATKEQEIVKEKDFHLVG